MLRSVYFFTGSFSMATSGKNVRTKCILFLSVLAAIPFVRSQSETLEEDCKCENPTVASSRVVNGTSLSSGLPWTGFLYIRTNAIDIMGFDAFTREELTCTSIVISPQWALTGKMNCLGKCFQIILNF